MLQANIKQRQQNAVTHLVKVIFPSRTNHYDTLFGGNAIKWMDEVAFITATRFARKQFVTVSSDRIDFTLPIPEGHIIELIGEVIDIGRTSLIIEVGLYLEKMYLDERHLAATGRFTLVAIDHDKNPVEVLAGM